MNARATAEQIVTSWYWFENRELFLSEPLHPRSKERLVAAIEQALKVAAAKKPAKAGAAA